MLNEPKPLLLSICIPTFNRGRFLEPLLNSIPDSYRDKVEVCVSDNASDDDTPECLARHRTRFPHFRDERRDRNYGFDNNLLHVVEMASGRYCWTIGSDDSLAVDALDILFNILDNERPSILIVNPILCSIDKRWEVKRSWLPQAIDSYRFNFRETNKIIKYLELAKGISAVGAFISTNIFERELWLNTTVRDNIASGYIHFNKINAMIFTNTNAEKTFCYLKKHLVYATLGNDTISLNECTAKYRLFIDLHAVMDIANAYIADTKLRQAFIYILRNQHPFLDLYRTAVIPDINDLAELDLLKQIFPAWQVFICRYFGYRRGGGAHRFLKFGKRCLSDLLCLGQRLKSFV